MGNWKGRRSVVGRSISTLVKAVCLWSMGCCPLVLGLLPSGTWAAALWSWVAALWSWAAALWSWAAALWSWAVARLLLAYSLGVTALSQGGQPWHGAAWCCALVAICCVCRWWLRHSLLPVGAAEAKHAVHAHLMT